VCNETGGSSGEGTTRAVNFDKSTAMEREQRAIDAMRARRQAELDQMVGAYVLASLVRAISFGVMPSADCLRGEAAASCSRTAS
jgi:hypothetical protein